MQKKEHFSLDLKWLIIIGYFSLFLSVVFLLLATYQSETSSDQFGTFSALLMMIARLAGLISFFVGAIAIFNLKWTHGAILFVGSVGLPVFSYFVYGSL